MPLSKQGKWVLLALFLSGPAIAVFSRFRPEGVMARCCPASVLLRRLIWFLNAGFVGDRNLSGPKMTKKRVTHEPTADNVAKDIGC
jgi:hypothetical protein